MPDWLELVFVAVSLIAIALVPVALAYEVRDFLRRRRRRRMVIAARSSAVVVAPRVALLDVAGEGSKPHEHWTRGQLWQYVSRSRSRDHALDAEIKATLAPQDGCRRCGAIAAAYIGIMALKQVPADVLTSDTSC